MANLTMRKKKNGERVFRIRCMVNGVCYNRLYPERAEPPIPTTWSDRKATNEAMKAAALFENDCKHNQVSNDKRTFSEYAKYVLDLKCSNDALKPTTLEKYRGLLTRIEEYPLGRMQVRNITVKQLNSFYVSLSSDGQNRNTKGKLSAATIRKYHAFISSVLHQAAREDIIPHNPAVNATLPRMEKKEANYYTTEKMAEIIEAIENEPLYWKALTYMLIGIGARRGEILGLMWNDIDFDDCVIHIRRNVTIADGNLVITSPKTGERRQVSIAPEFLIPMKAWRKEQADRFGAKSISGDEFCFSLDDTNRPILPTTVTRYFARLGKRYGLGHLNPHAFRHTQASILLQNGDIATATQRLGHSRSGTTLTFYAHMMPQTDREAAEKVGSAFLKRRKV